MTNGNGMLNKIFVGVVTLVIVGFVAYVGTFIISTKEALATNKREHQIFNEMAKDIKSIKKNVDFLRLKYEERFQE